MARLSLSLITLLLSASISTLAMPAGPAPASPANTTTTSQKFPTTTEKPEVFGAGAIPPGLLNKVGEPHLQCHGIYCDSLSDFNPQCGAHACGSCLKSNVCGDKGEL